MPEPILIADPADPRLAPYANVRDRDLAASDGLFIIEGQRALQQAIEHGRFQLASILLAQPRLGALASLVARADAPVLIAPQPVMDAVVGYHIHRGVLALATRNADASADGLLARLPPSALVLGLIGLSDADNVGACFRNAAAFGVDAVLLDSQCCDPLYRKAIRTSSGHVLSLPFARGGSGAAALQALASHGFAIWALSPTGGDDIRTLNAPPRIALILGAEGDGLPDHLIARSRRVTIPMAPGVDSLNVATAGAVALSYVAGLS